MLTGFLIGISLGSFSFGAGVLVGAFLERRDQRVGDQGRWWL